jgi:hypothetical protein
MEKTTQNSGWAQPSSLTNLNLNLSHLVGKGTFKVELLQVVGLWQIIFNEHY